MDLKTSNKEQLILEVAEKLFIEKGYNGVKTKDIAHEAGVNHALLHYYYRTKENLFNRIFEEKASQVIGSIIVTFDNDHSSFFEKIKTAIETHFELLRENPKLPLFILREIVSDKTRKAFILNHLLPIGKEAYHKLKVTVRKEIRRGAIRPVTPIDLLLNIASLNVFTFISAQILFDTNTGENQAILKVFLEARKKNNVELIINSLKP
jgi:AcrR family transcriptional regulator